MPDPKHKSSQGLDPGAETGQHSHWWLTALSIVVFVIAAIAIRNLLEDMSYARFVAEFKRLSAMELFLAVLFTALSFATLVGYDWSALRYLGRHLPFRTLALGSICGCAIANAAGWNFFSGASVRMRVYTAAGLSAVDVGRVALFGSTAYGASICVVGAAAQVISPDLTAGIFGLSPAKLSIIAWGFLVWLVFLFYRALRGEHSLGFGRFRLRMPGAGLMAFQLIIAVLDMVFTAACLYVLVPHHTELSFLKFLAASCISIAAGILSQIPGGLGIFEGAILFAFRNDLPPESLAAALLAYRLIYTVLPLLLAVAVLAFREVGERLPAVRRAD